MDIGGDIGDRGQDDEDDEILVLAGYWPSSACTAHAELCRGGRVGDMTHHDHHVSHDALASRYPALLLLTDVPRTDHVLAPITATRSPLPLLARPGPGQAP